MEVDGATHWDDAEQAKDEARDHWLTRQGFAVHRIPEAWIYRDLGTVAEDVLRHAMALIAEQASRSRPSPSTTRSAAGGPPPPTTWGR